MEQATDAAQRTRSTHYGVAVFPGLHLDVARAIFAYLAPHDLQIAALVCRSWCKLSRDRVLRAAVQARWGIPRVAYADKQLTQVASLEYFFQDERYKCGLQFLKFWHIQPTWKGHASISGWSAVSVPIEGEERVLDYKEYIGGCSSYRLTYDGMTLAVSTSPYATITMIRLSEVSTGKLLFKTPREADSNWGQQVNELHKFALSILRAAAYPETSWSWIEFVEKFCHRDLGKELLSAACNGPCTSLR